MAARLEDRNTARRAAAAAALLLGGLAWSAAAAEPPPDPPASLATPWADPELEAARASLALGRLRPGLSRLQRRMTAIERELQAGFAPPGDAAAARRVLDRWMGGPRPVVQMGRDRLYFHPDLYRALLWAAAAQKSEAPAAVEAACELLASGQATPADQAWVQQLSAREELAAAAACLPDAEATP